MIRVFVFTDSLWFSRWEILVGNYRHNKTSKIKTENPQSTVCLIIHDQIIK